MPFTTAVLPTFDDVRLAARRLEGIAHRTPVLRSATADALSRAQIFFKCENFQRTGAFKFRGAFNAISLLDTAHREAGVLAFSSGNHAQAIALAGRQLGVRTTIVMPSDASPAKLAATRGYGGEIVLYDRFSEDREAISVRLATERGLTLILPYDNADVIAGQGTAALELFEETGPLDALFVCLGGGGLLSGSILAAEALAPECAVFGVEPEAGNDGQQSLRGGKIVTIPVPRTIADGAMTTHLGELTFPIIQRHARDITTVSDSRLVETMRFFAERMKMIVEPTGCLAAGGAFEAAQDWRGARIGVLVSGGNIDLGAFARHITG
jgi:threonine dehydratase